jgi:RNA polymerase sigma-70 factor (ECF subfamily)
METDERDLVRRFRQGDRQAFDQLVSRSKRRLYSAIYRIARSHQATDELLQETFLKLYTSINKYDDSFPFYPWLYRIAVNNAINYLKREQKRSRDSSLDEEMGEHFMQPQSQGSFFDPQVAFVKKERDRKIMDALQQVSPTYRAALVLRVFQGLSYKEIADALECTVGTVMSRLNRARLQMRDLLKDYLKDGVEV